MNNKLKLFMKTTNYLLVASLMFVASCSEKEQSSCRVNIQLEVPEDYPNLFLDKVIVNLASHSQGTVYKSKCSSAGIAEFDVEYGYYTASVHYQTASGLIFSGRIESLALLSTQEVSSKPMKLQLNRSEKNALVIKEIYYSGCIGEYGEGYQADQYITLYNNSDEIVYLDGVCVAVVDPATNTESPWMKYTNMSEIPVNDLTWQFPGTGKDHPLAPGEETTIATNAVNHTGGEYQNPNSINLSRVDWGFWDVTLSRQVIQPGVTPMKLIAKLNAATSMYTFPISGPAIMVFALKGVSAEEFVEDMSNRKPRPQATNQNKLYLMIPKEWVIDCVECVESADKVKFKRVSDNLNHVPAYIPKGVYCGKSLVRKIEMEMGNRVIYQDNNDSSDDFEVSVPLLKK